jgi:hypothetical protein
VVYSISQVRLVVHVVEVVEVGEVRQQELALSQQLLVVKAVQVKFVFLFFKDTACVSRNVVPVREIDSWS